ncbi:MAG: hypothetical protein KDD51_08330 [Bdellovibrionales bacterium]|nr:hypothetical protein [Bdellovibrionales bacterium]
MGANLVRFLLVGVITFIVCGCGADRPLQRGHHVAGAPDADAPDKPYFETRVLKMLRLSVFEGGVGCLGCHGEKIGTYEQALKKIVYKNLEGSDLWQRATSGSHHGVRWDLNSEAARVLKAWILGTNDVD